MVSRINFFVELTSPCPIEHVEMYLQALDLPHVCYLAFLLYVFANGMVYLILLQAIFPSQILFENLENCLVISSILFIVSMFVWENIMFNFYL